MYNNGFEGSKQAKEKVDQQILEEIKFMKIELPKIQQRYNELREKYSKRTTEENEEYRDLHSKLSDATDENVFFSRYEDILPNTETMVQDGNQGHKTYIMLLPDGSLLEKYPDLTDYDSDVGGYATYFHRFIEKGDPRMNEIKENMTKAVGAMNKEIKELEQKKEASREILSKL